MKFCAPGETEYVGVCWTRAHEYQPAISVAYDPRPILRSPTGRLVKGYALVRPRHCHIVLASGKAAEVQKYYLHERMHCYGWVHE